MGDGAICGVVLHSYMQNVSMVPGRVGYLIEFYIVFIVLPERRPPTSGVRGAAASGPRAPQPAAPDSRSRQSPHLLVVGAGNSFGRLSGGHGGGCGKSRWRSDSAATAAALGNGGLKYPSRKPARTVRNSGMVWKMRAGVRGAEKEPPHKDGFQQRPAEDGCSRDRPEHSGSGDRRLARRIV